MKLELIIPLCVSRDTPQRSAFLNDSVGELGSAAETNQRPYIRALR
jgi:hypothetical protein